MVLKVYLSCFKDGHYLPPQMKNDRSTTWRKKSFGKRFENRCSKIVLLLFINLFFIKIAGKRVFDISGNRMLSCFHESLLLVKSSPKRRVR